MAELRKNPFNNWASYPTYQLLKNGLKDFPGAPVVKNPPARAGDTGLFPALERFHMLWNRQTSGGLEVISRVHKYITLDFLSIKDATDALCVI